MSHGESCAGVVGSGVGVGGHKKLRRKRKELDALVPEEKVRRKSSSASHHDLLRSDSEDPEADYSGVTVLGKRVFIGSGGKGGVLACLPGACTLLLLVTTLVGVAASLRLLMLTRKDLDSLHARISAVEASSSELPAKFHESHVRLQELERNQTALWAQVSQLSASLTATSKKVEQIETDVKVLKESHASSPQQLSSLSDLQSAVSTQGSSLEDVKSSLKVVRMEHDTLTSSLHNTSVTVNKIKEDILLLQNQTEVGGIGREGEGGSRRTIGNVVVGLETQLNSLIGTVGSFNTSLVTHNINTNDNTKKLQNLQQWSSIVKNLTGRVTEIESWQGRQSDKSLLANLTASLSTLQETSQEHQHTLHNITQSVDVVKGVERKLEGSQVQLANTVSELKQQFQKVEQQVSEMTVAAAAAAASTPLPPTASNETHSRKQRYARSSYGGGRESRGP